MLIVSLLFSSCYSYKPIISKKDANANNVSEKIKQITLGENYLFYLNNGFEVRMNVTELGKIEVVGKGFIMETKTLGKGQIPIQKLFIADIQDIKKRKLSAAKIATLVILPAAIILGLLAEVGKHLHYNNFVL